MKKLLVHFIGNLEKYRRVRKSITSGFTVQRYQLLTFPSGLFFFFYILEIVQYNIYNFMPSFFHFEVSYDHFLILRIPHEQL